MACRGRGEICDASVCFRWQYALCCWGLFACLLTVPAFAQEIVLKAWTIGPDDPSVYRATNLQIAAERLNAELAQAGVPERVKVDTDFWTGQAQQYGQRVLLAFQSGDIPDIVWRRLKRSNLLPCVSVNNCATRCASWNNSL